MVSLVTDEWIVPEEILREDLLVESSATGETVVDTTKSI